MNRLSKSLGMDDPLMLRTWLAFLAIFVPLSVYLRFHFIDNPLMDLHPLRQGQTALTTSLFAKGLASIWDYRSPHDGKLWNFVFEFPLYQWLSAKVMNWGVSLEAASRVVNILFFIGVTITLTWLTAMLTNRKHAAWVAVLLFTNPFAVIFSRTSLIDWTALFFSLLCLTLTMSAWKREAPSFYRRLVVATLAGAMSAVVKITIWYLGALAIGLVALWAGYRSRQWKKFSWIVASLAVQTALALSWTIWSKSVRGHSSSFYGDWLFGPLSIRFQWYGWKVIFGIFLSQSILQLWLVIPFVAAFVLKGPYRRLAYFALSFIFVEILIFFNVHSYHDYYLISVFPSIFLILGIGLVQLWQTESKWKRPAWILMGLLFLLSLKRLPVFYASLFHDYRPNLEYLARLNRLTDPKEVVLYFDEHNDAWYIPLYSERLVTTVLRVPFDELDPSVIHAVNTRIDWRWFSRDQSVWISGETGKAPARFWLYRRRGEGQFAWNPQAEIGATHEARTPSIPSFTGTQTFNTCQRNAPLVIEMPSNIKYLSIKFDNVSPPIFLPAKRFLSLPPRSIFGCEFSVFVG